MKSTTLFAAGILIVLSAVTLPSCHHRPAPDRIGWSMEESSDRLSEETVLSARLDAMAEQISALKHEMHDNRPAVDASGAQQRRRQEEMTDYLP